MLCGARPACCQLSLWPSEFTEAFGPGRGLCWSPSLLPLPEQAGYSLELAGRLDWEKFIAVASGLDGVVPPPLDHL